MSGLLKSVSNLQARVGTIPVFAVAILIVLLCIGLVEPWLPGTEFKVIGSGMRRAAPSTEFWLGTDNLGRSVLARVFEGIRLTFLLSAIAVLLAGLIGAMIGMAAAWYGGFFEMVVARFADILFSFPAIIFGLIIAAIIGPGAVSAVLAILFVVLPTMIRVVRGAALTVVNRDFVIASQISGASTLRILLVHVLPNVATIAIVQMAYLMSIGMILESSLSFLGLGIQPPKASLGVILRENSAFLHVAPWMVLGPGAVLTLAILCVNYVGDSARSLIDPAKPRPLE